MEFFEICGLKIAPSVKIIRVARGGRALEPICAERKGNPSGARRLSIACKRMGRQMTSDIAHSNTWLACLRVNTSTLHVHINLGTSNLPIQEGRSGLSRRWRIRRLLWVSVRRLSQRNGGLTMTGRRWQSKLKEEWEQERDSENRPAHSHPSDGEGHRKTFHAFVKNVQNKARSKQNLAMCEGILETPRQSITVSRRTYQCVSFSL